MDGDLDRTGQKLVFDFFCEQACPAGCRERDIEELVTAGFDDDGFSRHAGQERFDQRDLRQRQRTAATADDERVHW